MTEIRLPWALYQQLIRDAQAEPDTEVCGLLAGTVDTCNAIYPIKNISPDPQYSFCMDPQAQLAAMNTMGAMKQTMLGIYHSHPTTGAMPSRRDILGATYPEVAYLIISLTVLEQPQVAAFVLVEDHFDQIALVVGRLTPA